MKTWFWMGLFFVLGIALGFVLHYWYWAGASTLAWPGRLHMRQIIPQIV